MKTYYTPAPWRFIFENDGRESRVQAINADFGNICYLADGIGSDRLPDPTQEKANGNLIAAAPDLLQALEELTKSAIAERDCFYESVAHPVDGQVYDKDDKATLARDDAMIDKARAAIAKAKGETS